MAISDGPSDDIRQNDSNRLDSLQWKKVLASVTASTSTECHTAEFMAVTWSLSPLPSNGPDSRLIRGILDGQKSSPITLDGCWSRNAKIFIQQTVNNRGRRPDKEEGSRHEKVKEDKEKKSRAVRDSNPGSSPRDSSISWLVLPSETRSFNCGSSGISTRILESSDALYHYANRAFFSPAWLLEWRLKEVPYLLEVEGLGPEGGQVTWKPRELRELAGRGVQMV